MPNPMIPAAATGLPTAIVIPFPLRAGPDTFRPIAIRQETAAISEHENTWLRSAARLLNCDQITMARQFSNLDAGSERAVDRMLEGWADLIARLSVLADMTAEAHRRLTLVREGGAHG